VSQFLYAEAVAPEAIATADEAPSTTAFAAFARCMVAL
jgi:hypothetical protein